MAQTETSKSQPPVSSTKLSADAESFVPGKLQGLGSGPSMVTTDQDALDPNTLSQQQFSQLPGYVTSCYPFVKGESATNSNNNNRPQGGRWQGPGRPPNPNFHSQRNAGLPPGAYTFTGSRPPGPQNFQGGMRGVRSQGYGRPGFSAQNVANPGHPFSNLLQGQGPHPHAFPFGQQYPPQMGMPPGPGMWGQPPNVQQDYSGGHGYPTYPQYLPSSQEVAEWAARDRNKPSERKGKKKKQREENNGNMVSVGVQNESGLQYLTGSASKKKKPKTIICMDANSQTDFSDEIANLTLSEKASPLYRKDRPRNQWLYNQDSTTDSEEVDSDSGYSSPMHRRNQATNGTQSVVPALPYLPTPGGYMPQDIIKQHGIPFNPAYMPSNMQPGYPYHTAGSVMTSNFGSIPHIQNYPNGQAVSRKGGSHLVPNTYDNVCSNASNSVGVSNKNQGSTGALSASSVKTEPEEEEGNSSTGKKKRRRNRRKKKKGSGDDVGALSDEPYDLRRANSSSNVSRTSTVDNDITLHFEDENEFPNLLSSTTSGLQSSMSSQQMSPWSYSDILKSQGNTLSQESTGPNRYMQGMQLSTSTSSDVKIAALNATKESKNARKRRKRREMANRAADEELAEISVEQQLLRELSVKHVPSQPQSQDSDPAPDRAPTPPPPPKKESKAAPQPTGKKSKQPIALNIADMISALEKQQEQQKGKPEKHKGISAVVTVKKQEPSVANVLDSSAPVKRGKERELPKHKKPSPLKKVILKEREEKKRLRLLEESNPLSPGSTNSSQLASVTGMPLDSDLSQDGVSSKASSMDLGTGTPVSAEMSPISQTSPISMSPLSGSPLSSGVNSPIAGNNSLGGGSGAGGPSASNSNSTVSNSGVLMKIHSRRFREYCSQILDKDVDNMCTSLLQDLVRFQDRVFQKDPTKNKAKSKRRIVLGLREVTKHLKLKKIKCVVISPNLERIQSKGGLDEALNNIISMCSEQNVPFVFALGRRALGRACAKLVPVSVVGVFNYEGSEENFKSLMNLTEKARNDYKDMVSIMEKEMQENPHHPKTTSIGFPQLFPHMGHSRTPSACSAISFTSSILSEPICENYPHSEPETDSRGYEIVKNGSHEMNILTEQLSKEDNSYVKTDADNEEEGEEEEEEEEENKEDEDAENRSESPNSSNTSGGKMVIVESLDEIDEGHEADTEDDHLYTRMVEPPVSGLDMRNSLSECEEDSGRDEDTIPELPHIDSIHSSVVDLNAEILSQHSSKTIDLNTEVLSTHSSRTIEGRATPDRSSRNTGSAPDLREASNPAGPQTKIRSLDKERIDAWVEETTKQIETLNVNGIIEHVDEDPSCSSTAGIPDSNSCISVKECCVCDQNDNSEVTNACVQSTNHDRTTSESSDNHNVCVVCDSQGD